VQQLDPARTSWHITFGTYGARLHGSDRPTVDRQHNQLGQPFLERDIGRESREYKAMRAMPEFLTLAQQLFIQDAVPSICERGGWNLRICAAGPDHVHVLADIVPEVHGEKARRLLKRWLTQEMNKHWRLDAGQDWWAEEGSNKAIHDEEYLNNAYRYIESQRAKSR
jgi:REP element-mobilizing transposase RayT